MLTYKKKDDTNCITAHKLLLDNDTGHDATDAQDNNQPQEYHGSDKHIFNKRGITSRQFYVVAGIISDICPYEQGHGCHAYTQGYDVHDENIHQ